MFALALIGGAVLAWHQLKTNKEFKLGAYRTSLIVLEQLAHVDPGVQGAVSIAHEWIGDVLYDQGKLEEALASYRASLAIREQLTNDQPSNAVWQRGLSFTHSMIGDMLSDRGKHDEALESYLASLAIRERLAADHPDDARLQRDLSVIHVRVGDALYLQGEFDEALASYRESILIREVLAETDASNAEEQRDLSVIHGRIGNVLAAEGMLDEALASSATPSPSQSGWPRPIPAMLTGDGTLSFGSRSLPNVVTTRSGDGPSSSRRCARTLTCCGPTARVSYQWQSSSLQRSGKPRLRRSAPLRRHDD